MEVEKLEQFNNFVDKHSFDFYEVKYNDRILQKIMSRVPDYDSLDVIVEKIKKYLPNIQRSKINVEVHIDNKNYIVFINKL